MSGLSGVFSSPRQILHIYPFCDVFDSLILDSFLILSVSNLGLVFRCNIFYLLLLDSLDLASPKGFEFLGYIDTHGGASLSTYSSSF